MTTTPHRQSFKALRAAYAARRITPVDVTRSALGHASAVNAEVNAFAWLDPTGALACAEASAARWRTGAALSPLDGMPVTVKDMAAVQGWPTRRGSRLTNGTQATHDAVFVARLRAAGAVLLGKTLAPEFNWKGVTDSPAFGITRNPLDHGLTPGGSSGGCAAAVAAGVVRASIGSDAAGSVRIPAAFTGVLGLKPTAGRIPIVPFPSHFSGLAHFGPLAAGTSDLADILAIVSGPDSGDWTSTLGNARALEAGACEPRRLKVGVVSPDCLGDMDEAVGKGVRHMVAALSGDGIRCVTVQLNVREASEAAALLYRWGCAQALAGLNAESRRLADPGLLAYGDYAESLSLQTYMRAHAARASFAAELDALFGAVDVVMLPTVPIRAFGVGRNVPEGWPDEDWLSWNPYTPAFNLVPHPVLNYPVRPANAALPVGVQFVAPPLEEKRLLALGDWLDDR